MEAFLLIAAIAVPLGLNIKASLLVCRDGFSSSSQKSAQLLLGLTIALLAWGAFLGIGSTIGGANLQRSAGRGVVIFICTAIFLGFWWALLLFRKRRQQ